ncbi:GNAT family N-acetyltransferase [Staphylococcus canis]|uniref:GNAT family N-acetyltransferase n=1 Tax=Staphylococcus canis TaxID=2724942 RepID=A0ABS0T9G1_9STAP|nr:GNAT family protein [Staphylococcus canis]MBI5975097.1 GNAT family N-acetyltransferase [Staphylococcus canis]
MYHFKLTLFDDVSLVAPTLEHAPEIFKAIDQNRDHLKLYLDWVDHMQTIEDEYRFLKESLIKQAQGELKLYLLYQGEQLIGTIDLQNINRVDQNASVGYWLVANCTGRGIMTKAVRQLCRIAFQDLKLNKLLLRAEVNNYASQQVALRSGFRQVGILKKEVYRPSLDTFVDIKQYELLKEEFEKM